jgi:hypothetical protein
LGDTHWRVAGGTSQVGYLCVTGVAGKGSRRHGDAMLAKITGSQNGDVIAHLALAFCDFFEGLVLGLVDRDSGHLVRPRSESQLRYAASRVPARGYRDAAVQEFVVGNWFGPIARWHGRSSSAVMRNYSW